MSTKGNSSKLLMYAVVVGVVVNLALPALAKMVATSRQVTPPEGAAKLSLVDQAMHMLVHHAQVPLSSSVVVAVIVAVSVYGAQYLTKKM